MQLTNKVLVVDLCFTLLKFCNNWRKTFELAKEKSCHGMCFMQSVSHISGHETNGY